MKLQFSDTIVTIVQLGICIYTYMCTCCVCIYVYIYIHSYFLVGFIACQSKFYSYGGGASCSQLDYKSKSTWRLRKHYCRVRGPYEL